MTYLGCSRLAWFAAGVGSFWAILGWSLGLDEAVQWVEMGLQKD